MTQELCLIALEEAIQTDFEIICDDGRRIRCSRKTLEDRWPWFKAQLSKLVEKARSALETSTLSSQERLEGSISDDDQLDHRVHARFFDLAESYPVTLALLQYFYTLSLLTDLQQQPVVLSRLLELSTTLQIPRLQSLAKHAMHMTLSDATCEIYEQAARRRPGCEGLQKRCVMPFSFVLNLALN